MTRHTTLRLAFWAVLAAFLAWDYSNSAPGGPALRGAADRGRLGQGRLGRALLHAGLTSFSGHNATRPPHGGLVAWRGERYQGVSADGLATSNPASCQACSPPSSGRTLEKPARCSWRASRAADISAGQSQ